MPTLSDSLSPRDTPRPHPVCLHQCPRPPRNDCPFQWRIRWSEPDIVRHSPMRPDQSGPVRIHRRVHLRLRREIAHRLILGLVRSRRRRWHRFGHRAGRCLHHPADRAMLGPCGAVGSGTVRLPSPPLGLQPEQQRAAAVRLARHATGLRSALHEVAWVLPVLLREPHALRGVRPGRDALRGEVRLVGVDRQHGRDLRDRRIVTPREVLWRIADRRRQQPAQRVKHIEVGGRRQAERRVRGVRGELEMVHDRGAAAVKSDIW